MEQATANAFLQVTQGADVGRVHPVGDEALLGRIPTCGIVLTDPAASRQHARIARTPNGYILEDLNSANGTYLNNQRITSAQLNHGDLVRICRLEYRFGLGGSGYQPPAPATRLREPQGSRLPTRGLPPQGIGTLTDTPGIQITGDGSEQDLEQSIIHSVVEVEDHNIAKDLLSAQSETDFQVIYRRLEIINDISNQIGTILELNDLLNSVMDRLFEVFASAERGYVLMKDDTAQGLNPAVVKFREAQSGDDIQISRTIVKKAMSDKQAILVSDAAEDDRFESAVSIMKFNIRSMMCVPLVCQNEVLGIISIDTTQAGKKFRDDDLKLLTAIATPIATAVKNTQLVREKENEVAIRTSLQRFFSPSIVEEMANGQLSLGGERRQGVAFFSDIVGFTRMSNRLPAEDVVRLLNSYFEVMVDILFQHDATIDKFSGDAIMAVWGAPKAIVNQEWHAVQAALDMQNALYEFNCSQQAEKSETIEMGVGINFGSFIAGNVGSGSEMLNYTIIGDDVNLAARIEAKAGAGQVYISESLFEKVIERICAIQLPPTEVKGIPDPISIFAVRAVVPVTDPDSCELVVSLPVNVSTEGHDHTRAYFNWVEICQDNSMLLDLITTAQFQSGQNLSLRLQLPELPDLPEIVGEVTEVVVRDNPVFIRTATRVKVTSVPIDLEDLLRPGEARHTTVAWADLVR